MSILKSKKSEVKENKSEGAKKKRTSGATYLTNKEIRQIAKSNAKIMMALEKRKHRKAPESEFISEMKDPNNILEIDDLHTFFFTDQGIVKAVNGVSFEIPQNSTVGIVGDAGNQLTHRNVIKLIMGKAFYVCKKILTQCG